MMTAEDLLNTLEDLREEEFTKFKWYLKQRDFLGDYQTIKECDLEKADRLKTVELMVNAYKPHGALEVTKKVLEKIPRNDLLQSLPDTSSGPEVSVEVSDVGGNRGPSSSQCEGTAAGFSGMYGSLMSTAGKRSIKGISKQAE